MQLYENQWRRASRHNPCPHCGKWDWCCCNGCGWRCMRLASDHPTKNGGWWHPFDDAPGENRRRRGVRTILLDSGRPRRGGIPLFPELHELLMAVYEQAEPGSRYVITRYRDSSTNLRTQLQRIIAKAGLKPWPRLWHNLRSSRETELANSGVPLAAVVKWIGNSVNVAQNHYLQVTDDLYDQAAADAAAEWPRNSALPNALPQVTELGGNKGNGE